MSPKKKKTLITSISVVTVTAILLWYFLWLIAGKWFIYENTEFLHQLNVRPSKIENLPASPPSEWENISIDTLSLSLPMNRFNKIRVFPQFSGIGFISDQGTILLPDVVLSIELKKTLKKNDFEYPLISYEDRLAIFTATPDDISFFKSRNENKTAFINLTLKLIAIPVYGIDDLLAVNSSNLEAICIINEKRERGFGANITLYNQTENMTFDITLVGYKNSDMLHSDILNILGSIKMPGQPLNAEQAKADIESISQKYN